MKDKRQISAY